MIRSLLILSLITTPLLADQSSKIEQKNRPIVKTIAITAVSILFFTLSLIGSKSNKGDPTAPNQ